MSYYENNQSGGDRPGFTEQTSGSFNSGGYGGGNQQNNQQGSSNNYGSNQGSSNSNYGSNNGGGYNGGGRSNSYGSGGGNGGWKGNGGGGWKGGGKGGFNKAPMSPEQLQALQLPKRAIVMAGNFRAPESLAPAIREIAEIVNRAGFIVRASTTDGFDKMVQSIVPDAEFHIPWKGFGDCQNPKSAYDNEQSLEFAKRYYRDWGNLKETHQKIYAKNVRLVLGKSLESHAHAAIIWSEDGVESPSNIGPQSSHAGHIAAICHACNIPVINLSNPNAVQRLRSLIEGNNRV